MSRHPLTPFDPLDDQPAWPVDITCPSVWVKIDRWPCLDEFIRGVDVYRTKTPAPLMYRVVISKIHRGAFLVPNSIHDPRHFTHRFADHLVQFGFLLPSEPKVLGWHDDLRFIPPSRVFLSSPDYIRHPFP